MSQSIHIPRQTARNRAFDLLRILFATMVLLSHAPEIADGNASRELVHRVTHTPLTFGAIGVDGFFLLSGFLIVQSWLGDPELLNFLSKRVLRIIPGYAVAVLLSVLAVGLLAPGIDHFFRHLDMKFVHSIAVLSSPSTPPVFPGQAYPLVNGALYTIAYEFRCYLLVALFGLCGLLRRPAVWLACTALLLPALCFSQLMVHLHEPGPVAALFGEAPLTLRLTAIYFIGGCFFLFRDRIPFRSWLAAVAVALIIGTGMLAPPAIEAALAICGGYLIFFLGSMHPSWLDGMGRFPDVSYGIYLYGWPVESLWIWFHHGSPWLTFLVSTVLCFALGWLSWHFVERPMLRLKRRPTAPLPSP